MSKYDKNRKATVKNIKQVKLAKNSDQRELEYADIDDMADDRINDQSTRYSDMDPEISLLEAYVGTILNFAVNEQNTSQNFDASEIKNYFLTVVSIFNNQSLFNRTLDYLDLVKEGRKEYFNGGYSKKMRCAIANGLMQSTIFYVLENEVNQFDKAYFAECRKVAAKRNSLLASDDCFEFNEDATPGKDLYAFVKEVLNTKIYPKTKSKNTRLKSGMVSLKLAA